MVTGDPLSLGQAKRLASTADTILLRATRSADLETPIGAFLRLDDGGPGYLLESVEGGERLGRYSFLGVGPRRLLQVRDGRAHLQTRPIEVDQFDPSLPVEVSAAADPLAALRAFIPQRRVVPVDGMPRFTGGAVGALAYDAVAAFEPTVPLPEADPVGVPTAAFIESDLVLVFDHLTHTLSAIASLHTDAPDLEGRYAIAERAIFEALERTARPSAAEIAGVGSSRNGSGRDVVEVNEADIRVSLRREEYEDAVRVAKDAIAAGEAIQVVLARRQSIELPLGADGRPLAGIELYRALRRINPSPYLFYVRMPTFEVVGASPELLLQVEGDRLTTHPIAGTRPRGATPAEDQVLSEQLQRDPKERAEHVMLVDLGRNDLGRVARAGTVSVTKYMEVEKFSHVLHLVSHVEGRLAARRGLTRCAARRVPGGDALGSAEGPGDAADCQCRARAARPLRRRRRVPRLRRQPRHGDHDPKRRAARRHRPRHGGGGDRCRQRARARVRGDRAQGCRDAACDRASRRRGRGGRDRRPGWGGVGRRCNPGVDHAGRRGGMILVIDNYDSFTFNLVQALQAAGADIRVLRNDAIDRAGIDALASDPASDLRGIVISPGPGNPGTAGVSVDAVRAAAAHGLPMLGVCLGMQSMAAAFGASIVRAPTLVHGEASEIRHDGEGLLEGMPEPFSAARYHSLCVDAATLPADLRITAMSDVDGVVMGLRHTSLPLEGVQFHPESVLTPDGPHLLANFLRQAGEGEWARLDARTGSFATSGLGDELAAEGEPVEPVGSAR